MSAAAGHGARRGAVPRDESASAEASGINPVVIGLVRESARWCLLGRLFECPADAWREDIARLAAEVDDPDLQEATRAALREATEGQYHSVFGPGGPAPPREVSYHDTIELGSLMSEVTGHYEAFGYHPNTDEPPDHVAVETGFVSYLYLKEAYALAAEDVDRAVVTAEARSRFLANHVAVVAAPIAAVLADSEIDYLVRASGLLSARTGDPPRRTRLPVIQTAVESDEAEFPCGE